MNKEVLINVGAGETRIALVRDARLREIILERVDEQHAGRAGHSILTNIYLGRVQRVLPGMQAAFVEIGLERCGFLGAREAQCLAELAGYDEDGLPPIAKCVHEGEEILVQVVKDPIGDKGARLSANVTLPGRLVVFVPNQSGVAMSRRIEDEAERERLTDIMETIIDTDLGDRPEGGANSGTGGFGYIVRTAAIGASPEELLEDAKAIREEWRALEIRRQSAPNPSCLYFDLNPVSRALRDHVDGNTTRVLIDDQEAFEEARHYADRHMPDVLDRIRFHRDSASIFELYDIEAELESALSSRVSLPQGGWITIETTEALTAVDVNSGSYTSAGGLEETSFHTNLEAARELMRQLRLRGIGGLIVIDFIHMADPDHNQKVLDELNRGAEDDRTPVQISGMSEFGLVEMTRKRVREPLARLMTENCGRCGGDGRHRTASTIAQDALRAIERAAKQSPGQAIKLVTSRDVADWLGHREHTVLHNLQKRVGRDVDVIADDDMRRDSYDVVLP